MSVFAVKALEEDSGKQYSRIITKAREVGVNENGGRGGGSGEGREKGIGRMEYKEGEEEWST